MAQVTDRTVGANPTGFDMRTEINNIIAALESDNSGSSEPLNTVAYMKWVDTSNATYYYVKERNHDNTAWVTLFRYTVATKIMEAVSNGVILNDVVVHKTGNETKAGVLTLTDGLKLQGQNVSPYSGFKNYIINGGFEVSQRGTSFTAGGYGLDRWLVNQVGGGVINVTQTYVGNNSAWLGAKYVWQGTPQTGVTGWNVVQRVEGVETLNGKSVTVSFTAAVSTGTMSLADSASGLRIRQDFGTGGSAAVNIAFPNTITLNTTPTRYTATVSLPSINGKTVGGSSFLELVFQSAVVSINQTLYIAQVQLEEGSVATPFEQRPYAIEEMMCQRYLPVFQGNVPLHFTSNAGGWAQCVFKTKARVAPSGFTYTVGGLIYYGTGNTNAITAIGYNGGTVDVGMVTVGGTGTPFTATQAGTATLPKLLWTGCEL